MKFYYERTLTCGCGRSERQTSTRMTLDHIGRQLAAQHEKRFAKSHKCKSTAKATYSDWRAVWHDRDEYRRRY